jgi:cytochrome c
MQYKSVILKLVACSIAVFASTMPAHADLALAQKNACMACHAKYAKEKDYVAKLAASIKAGGSGKYGPIPMPAQSALPDADATKLAKWILAGAKQ